MIRFIYLQRALNTLHHAKEDREKQNPNSDPKCIPLYPIPPIKPPLGYCSRLGMVKSLFKHYKSIVPVVEPLNLPILEP
jgi:hypothetical protein